MNELLILIAVGAVAFALREIASHEYLTWAGLIARGVLRLACRIHPPGADEWRAELCEVQEVRRESGLGFAGGAVLSSLRMRQWRRRKTDAEAVAPASSEPPATLAAVIDDRLLSAVEFGARVRTLRQLNGVSQEGLARRTGLNRSYISHIENGKANPALITVIRLGKGLGVDPGRLLAPPSAD